MLISSCKYVKNPSLLCFCHFCIENKDIYIKGGKVPFSLRGTFLHVEGTRDQSAAFSKPLICKEGTPLCGQQHGWNSNASLALVMVFTMSSHMGNPVARMGTRASSLSGTLSNRGGERTTDCLHPCPDFWRHPFMGQRHGCISGASPFSSL